MALLSWLTGDVSSTGCRAVAELDGGTTARMVVSTSAGLPDPSYGPAVSVTAQGIATLTAPTLTPDTRYYLGVEVDGVINEFEARVWTDPTPGTRADVVIRAASCAGQNTPYPGVLGNELAPSQVSNSPVWLDFARAGGDWVRRAHHMGDWTYYDLGSDRHGIIGGSSVANLRRMFSDFLGQPNQKVFWSSAASVLINDDHELNNDHDGRNDGLPRLRQVYSERVPHSQLLVPGTLYREETIGRVLNIYLDVRSNRSPNDATDGPSKTMLGVPQRERLEQTLRAAGDNPLIDYVLVFGGSVWWQPNRLDGWDSFQWEQNRIINVIHEAGLKDRLDYICGDVHALGMDSGGNSPGGIRTATFAAIDSAGGSAQHQNDLGATSPGRGRWGTIEVRYGRGIMQVRLTGYIGTEAWRSHTRTIEIDDDVDPIPPPDDLPDDTPATATSVVEWYACDAVTGDVIAYMPGITGDIEWALCAYSTSTLKLPVPLWGQLAPGPMAYWATRPGRTIYVCVINKKPAWAGLVTRVVDGVGVDVEMSVASLEAYLLRHYVGTHRWVNLDEAAIVRGLLGDASDNGIHMVVDAPETGVKRTREYQDTDDATVYDRLTELSEVEGGPEWTIVPEWEIPERRMVAVFKLRRRIGKSEPTATLSTTGATRASWRRTRDYGHGAGATHVIAYSSAGEGEDRPQSRAWIAEDLEADGMPRYEYRWSPSSSITTPGVLESHAARRLALTQHGTTTLEITVRRDAEPGRWGVDWMVGDTVGYDLRGHTEPQGITGTARVIGARMSLEGGLITPVLTEVT